MENTETGMITLPFGLKIEQEHRIHDVVQVKTFELPDTAENRWIKVYLEYINRRMGIFEAV